MAKFIINLNQGEAKFERREGRLLNFPDGMPRIITLPMRMWTMYDELSRRWVYPGLFEDDCFDIAHQYGAPGDAEFEDNLSWLFGLAIEAGWALLNEEHRGNVNQNELGKK
jgi:hypothetical protein